MFFSNEITTNMFVVCFYLTVLSKFFYFCLVPDFDHSVSKTKMDPSGICLPWVLSYTNIYT